MKKIRLVHLYLGCFFAPMLIFFVITGVLQSFDWHHYEEGSSKLLAMLSTLHTSDTWKVLGTWSTPLFKWSAVLMAASFILSTLLGVFIALKYAGKRRAVYLCLAAGVLIPLLLLVLQL